MVELGSRLVELGLEMLFQAHQAPLQAQKRRSKEQSCCRRMLGDYSDFATRVGNRGGNVAFGAGAEVMMLPALVGQQEEEEQERKQCP